MPSPDKSTYRLAVVRPVWLPFNKTAELIVNDLISELGYPTTGPKAAKYAVVVASMLKAIQTVEGSSRSEQPTYLGILSLPIFTGPCQCLGNGGPPMANKRARPEDIITKLRQVEVLMGQGMPRLDAIRQIGVVEQTYYRWRKQYGGMGLDQLKELKRLQKENEQLRRAVSDLTLDKLILKEAAKGNF